MKNWKRLTTLGLSVAMILGMVSGCGNSEGTGTGDSQAVSTQQTEQASTQQTEQVSNGKDLSWLNSSQTLPLVKEGTEKTLTVYVGMPDGSPEPEDTWFYQFVEEAMNINLEVTKFTSANKAEFISLAFVSGELPDLIIAGGFSAPDLVKYGAIEGQLMDMAPYLNETYMPNLTAIYEANPEYKTAIQDSEEHIWSFGFISDGANYGMISRAYMNYSYLEELNLKIPETLDEFLDAMRAIKAAGLCEYPIGGSYARHTPLDYILNAFGYVYDTNYTNGMKISLRNGEVVLPVADREAYGEFLKVMKTCYDEGLIHPDFFTMDKQTTENRMATNLNAFYVQAASSFLDSYDDWWGALPLTSEYNDTQQWAFNTGANSCGGVVVSSTCEEPELVATFIDWFYTYRTYYMSEIGPNADHDTEYLYGYDGWVQDEENPGRERQLKYELEPEINQVEYMNTVHLWDYNVIGTSIWDETAYVENPDAWAKELKIENLDEFASLVAKRYEPESLPDKVGWVGLASAAGQFITREVYPSIVYLDAETSEQAGNLLVGIKEYAQQETAKFITGGRSLDELDDYFDEIERLGATEYVQIYKDYYESVK